MKLGPVTKTVKRKSQKKKKKNWQWHHFTKLSNYCHFSNLLPVWSNSETRFQKHSVKNLFSLILTFDLTKTENRNKISLTQLSHYCYFCQLFLPKNADIRKIKWILILKDIFWLHMCIYLQIKFQVSSIILKTG